MCELVNGEYECLIIMNASISSGLKAGEQKRQIIFNASFNNQCCTLPNRIPSVQECDATVLNSSNTAQDII